MQTISTSIVGRFGPKEASLEGDARDLRILAQALKGGEYPVRVTLRSEGTSPKPYDRLLEDVVISESTDLVLLSVAHRTLTMIGAHQYLTTLAANIIAVGSGDQSHLEYFPGNVYISAQSVPLVVECT